MKKIFYVSLFVLGLTAAAIYANCGSKDCAKGSEHAMKGHKTDKACDSGSCGKGKKIKIILHKAEKLKLTEDQKTKLNDLKTGCQKEKITKQAAIDIILIDIGNLLMTDKPDLDAIKDKINKKADLQAEIEFKCVETGVNATNVLNDEQKAKLKDLFKKKKKK